MNLNKCTLAGRLVRDPEIRVTPKGTSIAQFGLAINRQWKNDAGEKQEEVTFLDCEAWGKTAETIAKYFTKGRAIYVETRAKVDSWEDKDTKQKRSKVKFVVESFQFCGDAPKADAPAQRTAAPASEETDVGF